MIASSIMSKKLAAGADGFVLDVKVGSGMQDLSQAQELAETMVGIGQGAGRSVVAYLTAMDQPLGYAVGNSLEVIEAIKTLKGQGPSDLTELCLTLGSEMLVMAKQADSIDQARDMLDQAIASGAALDKFRQLIVAQGDPKLSMTSALPQATYRLEVKSDHQGYVAGLDARTIGNVSMHLGAGRRHKDDAIDLSAGVLLHKKVGDLCRRGETLAALHSAKPIEQALVDLVQQAFGFSEAADSSPLVLERIAAE